MNHNKLPYEALIAYAAGDLSGEQAAWIERLLERSGEARKIVERYRQVSETFRSDRSGTPPARVIERAKRFFQSPGPGSATPKWFEVLQSLIATLSFDSRAEPALAGTRSADSDRVQLGFTCELGEIDLMLTRDDGATRVTGEVMTDVDGPFDIAVFSQGDPAPVREQKTDGDGIFQFETDLAVFDLLVRIGDRTMQLKEIAAR